MRIGGLQKFTLLDYPEKIAAVVFTLGCNFRCPFCHNPTLVMGEDAAQNVSEEAFFTFLAKRLGRLDGVCVTGGEPLLQKDCTDFLRRIKRLGFLVKLDTNGSFPEKLEAILDEHLVDYVAMDIKNSPEKYAETAGVFDTPLNNIKKSANLLLKSSISYEFRTTLVREFHTPNDLRQIGGWLSGGQKYCLQNFRDSERLANDLPLHPFSEEEIREMGRVAEEFFPVAEVRI